MPQPHPLPRDAGTMHTRNLTFVADAPHAHLIFWAEERILQVDFVPV